MPTLGYTGLDGDNTTDYPIENDIRGQALTMPAIGRVTKVTARIRNTNEDKTAQILIYRASDQALLASSETQTVAQGTTDNYEFSFSSRPIIKKGEIYLCVWTSGGSGLSRLSTTAGQTAWTARLDESPTWPTIPDPLVSSEVASTRHDIFLTYTKIGGGAAKKEVKKIPIDPVVQKTKEIIEVTPIYGI